MKPSPLSVRPIAFFAALVFGLGLVFGLLVVLGCQPASEAQVADPVSADLAAAAAQEQAAADEAVEAAQSVAGAPPATASTMPASPGNGVALPAYIGDHSRVAPSGRPQWAAGGPPFAAPAGNVPASAPGSGAGTSSGSLLASGAPFLASAGAAPALASAAAPSPLAPAGLLGGASASAQEEALLTPPMPSASADLAICMTTERVWGIISAWETVTVSVNGAQMGADEADQIGFFWTTLYDAGGNRPDLSAGDTVDIYHDDALSASVTLRAITATVDVVSNVVSGTIGGSGFPISVTVYAPEGEPSMTSYSQTVSTDGAGSFSADFTGVCDIVPWDEAAVAYVDGGVEVHRHVYPTRFVALPSPLNLVIGWTTPGGVVTATVLSDSVTIREQATGTANASGRYELNPTILTSDMVFVELADETVMSRTADVLTENIDPANDRITGLALPGAIVRGLVDDLTPLGWRSVQTSTIANPSGVYTVEFSGIADIMPGQWSGVHVADDEGDDLAVWRPSPSVEVNQTYNEVSGNGAAPFGLGEGWPVTLTLYSAVSDTTFVYSKGMESWYGWYNFNQNDGLPDIAAGDVVTVESEGFAWQGVVRVMTMTVESDQEANQFIGTVELPTERVELSGRYNQPQLYPAGGQFDMLVTASSPFTASPPGFDVNGDLSYDVAHRTAGEYVERISRRTDGIGEVINYNSVGGAFNPPGVAYTITLYNSSGGVKTQVTGNSEPTGNFWINLWDYGQQQIEVGDYLQGQSAAGFTYTVQIPAITINPNLATNVVSGQGPANELLLVTVDNQGRGFVPTDGSGQFAIAVDQLQEVWGNGDFEWGDHVWVNYYDATNAWLVSGFQWPHITVRTRIGVEDVIGNNAFPGNTIYITVTDPYATVVATGTTEAGACEWAGPTDYCLVFPSGTLVPSNTVTVDFGEYEGSVYVDFVEVVTLTGQADVANDWVTGTAPADGWASGWVEDVWGNRGPDIGVQVDASGVYTLDFGSQGWDVWYGDSYHVYYAAPHGHEVEYYFWLPAPEVGVEKWSPGGIALPGGKYVYSIRYWNDGNGVATDTLIVDTLPMSTTYFGDTSGVTPTIGAEGVITWNLGNLPPPGNDDNWGIFAVTLDVSDTVPTGTGSLTENCAAISTAAPGDYDSGNDSSCTNPVDVWEDDVNIGVNKGPNPGDPTPGQEFDYIIQWCGTSGASFGPAWLTDTLPISSTLVDWSTDWPPNMWTEVITTGGQLALYAPGLPGGFCQNIYLRLLLDPGVPLGTVLQNTVVVTTPHDRTLDDNIHINTDARVGPPRYDVRADKGMNSGMLVPGGRVNYHVSYNNQGNHAVHAWLTDTLPAGTSYQSGSAREQDGGPAFPPATVTDEVVVWDLGVIGVNQGMGLDFTVDVSTSVDADTAITNCATVGITEAEDTPWDNTDCVTETINGSGPNLRVRKDRGWNGDNQLDYTIQFYNVGDETINDVWITDTLPAATAWDGWWNLNFDNSRLISQSLDSSVLMWEFSPLYPGDSGGIEFHANLDDPNDRPRWYTNTVEITTPHGDTNPDDNTYTDVAVKAEVETVELMIDPAGGRGGMWGSAVSGWVTVTTPYTTVVTWADPGNNPPWGVGNEIGPIDAGDTIVVKAGSGLLPVTINIPDPFTAEVNSAADIVFGQIAGWANQTVQVDGWWPDGYREVQTDGSGNYLATYGDVPRGAEGNVYYETVIDYAQVVFHRLFRSPDLILTVNPSHDWVETNYEAGHTIWITVTDGITATMVDTTAIVPWWGGQTGFSTNMGNWVPSQPDIAPDDWVYGALDNGYTSSVQVGTITGNVDAASNTVSGTVTATWFTQTLNAQCWIDNVNDSNQSFTVSPGGGAYACDFSAVWDLTPGETVSVQYQEPDGDWVRAVFQEPAADVAVDKYGYGQPAPGGNYAYRINYHNHGDAAAGGVVITDTLPSGMTYITDTSGISPTLDGQAVIWDMGSVDEYVSSFFDVFVSVDGGLTYGTPVTNTVEIATPDYDSDSGNNYHEWWTDVITNEVHLNVGKSAWTGDPAAGYDVVFTLNPCNNSPAGSSWFTLTDTLHPALTLQTWWGQHSGWVEVFSDDHTLVLSRPFIAGWSDQSCSQVYLRAHVDEDAWQGMSISNTVVITASNDVESGDNETTWWGNVNNPHTNLYIGKWWSGGQLVPGGEIRYQIEYHNNGNVPVTTTVHITDTFPVSTTLVSVRRYDYNWNDLGPVTPTLGAGYATWEVGAIDNGYWGYFEIVLRVDDDAAPSTVLTNTAEISPQPDEDSYLDNIATVVETLYGHGPNLRVRKWSWWNGSGQLGYQIQFENVGDDPVSDVWITDTLPVSTTWDGWWNMGFDWNRLVGDIQSGGGQLWWNFTELNAGDSGWLQFNANLDESDVRLRWFTNTVEIAPSDAYPTDNTATDVAFSGGEVDWVDVYVYDSHIQGGAPSGPITITTAYEERVVGGGFDEWMSNNFLPGDVVTVTAGAGVQPVVIEIPDPFDAQASSTTETVWGQIDALDHEAIEVQPDDRPAAKTVQTDGSGNYSAAFPDIPRGGAGEVRYRTTIDYASVTFHRRFQAPDLILVVHYGDDWVMGSFETGHTVYLTVTTSGGTIKATAAVSTTPGGYGWGGDGFDTGPSPEVWTTGQPDIAAGDWVTGCVDSGQTTTVQVGTISGNVVAANDSITGTIAAAWWLSQTVDVQCQTWGAPGWAPDPQNKWDYDVLPDGADIYSCSWNPTTEWDVQPGERIAVFYQEPDRNWVGNVFHEPAADVAVDKYGQGQPAPGGNYTYRINYHNHGDAAAGGVVITDTLPSGMAYITDTSGISPTLDGQSVIWDLGSVNEYVSSFFDIFVSVGGSLTPGERVTNTVDIATPDHDTDPDNNHHEWWTEVISNDTHLDVGKSAWTNDPAPGSEFVYNVNVCNNNSSTSSSQVTLTDTLHISTTLQYWWARESGWTEMFSDDHTLVLSQPTIPNGQCYEVYLRVTLDENAWQGMSISNTAVISASNDLDGNNETTWWGNVNSPHTNLYINKWWNWGQLVPGGEIRYQIEYHNNGNVPVTTTVRITDTFPVSTTLVSIWRYDYNWNDLGPVTPTLGAGYATWEVGAIDNGYWGYFEIALQVDSDATPGIALTNTVEISPQPDEDSYDDNVSTWVETLFDHGPNLRVRKDGYWHDWGSDTRQIEYNIAVENIGDERVDWVTITDTYPSLMYMKGGIGFDPGRWWDWRDDPANHTFTATFEYLYPGDSLRFNAYFITDTSPIPLGLILTNTVEVMRVLSETNYADNSDDKVLTTGPDLYVEKTLVGGEFLPGEVITFSLRFGNDQQGNIWWWNMQGSAWLTDTLPAELDFITATRRSWGWAPFTPDLDDGTHVAWNVGGLCTSCSDEIYLTVRITDTAEGGDLFTNQVEIASDQPSSDAEPYYDNNGDDYDVLIVLPRFEVSKVSASSQVAGIPVTYTLTVTNTGNQAATNVVLSDTLPAGLDYGGGGSYDGTDVTWTIGSLAAGGGKASRWFSGTLPCASGSITNADYRVVSSDQGVSSPPGAPVVLPVAAPAIVANVTRAPAAIVVSQTVYFTATASTNGTPLNHAWAFGDGAIDGGGLTASHVYTHVGIYTAVFTATDGCGYSKVVTATVTVSQPAFNVSFTRNPATLIGCGTVYFTSTSTSDGPPIVAWGWAFGDGGTGTGQTTSHLYTAGAYTVTHVVTDGLGYSGTGTFPGTVVVDPSALNASFNQSGTSVAVSTTVAFTDTSTTGGGPAIAAREWDFGDGSAHAFTQNASHVYTALGTYTVTLTVTDTCSYHDVQTGTVTVRAPNLVADFITFPSPANILKDDTVAFTDTSATDGVAIVVWAWDFGDGGVSAAQHPTHTYTTVGTYTVSLVVTNALDISDSEVKPDIVVVSPRCTALTSVNFTYAPLQPLVQSPVVFTATYAPVGATQPVTYAWTFGDGATSAGAAASVQHTYAATGTRTVSVTAYNLCTPGGVSAQAGITVEPRRIYLPLVLRNYH